MTATCVELRDFKGLCVLKFGGGRGYQEKGLLIIGFLGVMASSPNTMTKRTPHRFLRALVMGSQYKADLDHDAMFSMIFKRMLYEYK